MRGFQRENSPNYPNAFVVLYIVIIWVLLRKINVRHYLYNIHLVFHIVWPSVCVWCLIAEQVQKVEHRPKALKIHLGRLERFLYYSYLGSCSRQKIIRRVVSLLAPNLIDMSNQKSISAFIISFSKYYLRLICLKYHCLKIVIKLRQKKEI